MSDQDARKQSLRELHERRRQVIRLHKKSYGVMQIVELTGLSWPAVRAAIDLYEVGGMAALKPKERAREPGDGRRLTAAQEDHIRKLIIDKRPEQLKMEFALWTRAAVGELIEREYGIKLCARCRRLPEALGFYAAEAHYSRLRAASGGHPEMAG